MRSRTRIASRAALTAGATLAVLAVALLRGGQAPGASAARPTGTDVSCRQQSGADFRDAYADRANLVVGPLALIGGATLTDAATVREFGGNKFPLLLRPGHKVVVSIARGARSRGAGLHYASVPGVHHTLAFVACAARRSASSANGRVTFWSGFVRTRVARCLALDVYVDGEPRRRVGVPLGRRCTDTPASARRRAAAARHARGPRSPTRPAAGAHPSAAITPCASRPATPRARVQLRRPVGPVTGFSGASC